MSNWLYRLGRGSARHHWVVVASWVLVAVGFGVFNAIVDAPTADNFEVPGVESQEAVDLLGERFPERAGATAMVVFHSDDAPIADPSTAPGIESTITRIGELDHVISVTDPIATPLSISEDGRTAFASVQYDATTTELGAPALEALVATAAPAEAAGVQVEFGGEVPTILKERDTGPAEMVGIAAALIILLIALRAVIAAVMSPLVAGLGLLTGLSSVGLLGWFIDIPSVAPRLGMMIGLGVGIDYALFVLSRHRDNLDAGMDMEESIGVTNATAGQAVVVAGGTVVVAILGLQMSGIPFVAALGYSTSIVVAIAVLVAITLLPALLSIIGPRVLSRSHRQARAALLEGRAPEDVGRDEVVLDPAGRDPVVLTRMVRNEVAQDRAAEVERVVAEHRGGWLRWAYWVSHHPWRSGIVAALVLGVLAIPMFDMRLGQADGGSDPTTTTHRRAYDLLADGFGEGFNGPLLIVVDLGEPSDDPASSAGALLEELGGRLREEPAVEMVSPPSYNDDGDTALITIIPVTKPQDLATSDLVHHLRDDVLPVATAGTGAHAMVGGPTAQFVDQSDKISSRLPWFIGTVVSLSFILLTIVFRSILVPLKAALLNLLAIGAAYGVVVAVFQWGWGSGLIGLEETIPIAPFVPMMMFAILFGLSMDYEVFILSRIREEYVGGHDNIDSVVVGLGATAKVITAAALIMISVFLGFVNSGDPVVKMMGIGLATAVAIDATIVRMVLVPSTMALMGDANWWLPKWLDRVLPRIDLE